MSYLLLNNDENILINKVGESIYIRSYPIKYQQKSNILGKSSSNEYTVSIDDERKIHLIYKTSLNSILHIIAKDSNYSTTTLLEDPNNLYKITNLQMVSGNNSYLFYCAINPYENTNDLIFHNFTKNEAPQSLLSLQNLNSKYLCTIFDNYIYLLCCILNENNYELNIYKYNTNNNQWEDYEKLVISEYPIVDFCFVVHMKGIYIAYTIEKFGHSTLYFGYKHKDDFLSTEIISTGQQIKPVIFIYNDLIWINYITSKTLFACFSNNNGKSFSKPLKCTLQNNNANEICILGYKRKKLFGDFFLGYLDQQPNIAVLSQIDLDNFLFYTTSNIELQEMLNATANTSASSDELDKLKKEITELKDLQKNITNQYNELANFTKDVQNEGKKWRKKYQKAYKEIKELKGEGEPDA